MDVATLRIAIQTGDVKAAEKELEKLERQSKDTEKATDKLSLAWGAAGAAIVATVFAIGRASVQAAQESEQANAKMLAVLQATGYAAGLTKIELDELADSMAASTRFDDESIKNASAVLLTFRNVQGDTFRQGIALASDLASVMGSDLNSAALQVGKALNDPIQGVSALSRVGIQFSEVQKDQIQKFVETNQLAKAQEVILGELSAQVGGTAEAMNTGLTKATADLSKALGELFESVGNATEVQTTVTVFSETSSAALKTLTDEINKTGSAWSGLVNFIFKPFDFNLLGFDDGTAAAKEFDDELKRIQKRAAEIGAARQQTQQSEDTRFAAEKQLDELRKKALKTDAEGWVKAIEEQTKEYEDGLRRVAAERDEQKRVEMEQNKQVTEFLWQEAERKVQEDFANAEAVARKQIAEAQKVADENKRISDELKGDLSGAFQAGFRDADNFAKTFTRALGDSLYSTIIKRISDALAGNLIDQFLGKNGANLGNLFSSTGNTGASSGASSTPSFDGGGFTGMGSRAGGADGKGGFMAMLHPNETVIDHSKGQAGGIVYAPVITVDARSDRADVQRTIDQAVKNGNAQLIDQLTRQQRI